MPEAGPGQVTIRTRAAAINPVDGAVQASGIFVKEWPNIVGCDVAGDIIQVGDGVNNFVVGDRVTSYVALQKIISNAEKADGFVEGQALDQPSFLKSGRRWFSTLRFGTSCCHCQNTT